MSKQIYTIKNILLDNSNWKKFSNFYKNRIRPSINKAVNKILSCKETFSGYHEYCCSNPNCKTTKIIPHTCKSRACSSCGKKSIELWIFKQNNILPDTTWQHITFTMPSELWDLFWYNRFLFNDISALAAECIKMFAKNHNVTPGIFTAIHSFGRDLKRNVHVHLSSTTGGIDINSKTWKSLFFPHKKLKKLWKNKIIQLFRNHYNEGNLTLTPELAKQINHCFSFSQFLNTLYKKKWVVHCALPNDNYKYNLEYFGRYTKRPPIAESKLKHYSGEDIVFSFKNHTTGKYQDKSMNIFVFIAKFIQHIPDQGFRMIRYYGFLANRVRRTLLNTVYSALKQAKKYDFKKPSYVILMIKSFGKDPLSCIHCGCTMNLTKIFFPFALYKQQKSIHFLSQGQ